MNPETKLARPRKITVLGVSGGIGEEVYNLLNQRGAADLIVGWNRSDPKEINDFQGRQFARDQANIINAGANGHEGETPHFVHAFGYENLASALEGADIVIVTVGAKREKPKPDEALPERDFLLKANSPIIEKIAATAKEAAPNATYLIATNPLDTMTQLFQEKSGIAPNKIIGLSGELDRARLIQAIAYKLQVHHRQIKNARVYGQHGPNMAINFSEIQITDQDGNNPRKLTEMLSQEECEKLRQETVKGGEKLVGMLDEGSDHVAPAFALNKMALAVTTGQPIVGSAYSQEKNVYFGQQVQFNPENGTYQTMPMNLSNSEQQLLGRAVTACQEAVSKIPGRRSGTVISAA